MPKAKTVYTVERNYSGFCLLTGILVEGDDNTACVLVGGKVYSLGLDGIMWHDTIEAAKGECLKLIEQRRAVDLKALEAVG